MIEFLDKIKNIILKHRGSDANQLKLDLLSEIRTEEERLKPICPKCKHKARIQNGSIVCENDECGCIFKL